MSTEYQIVILKTRNLKPFIDSNDDPWKESVIGGYSELALAIKETESKWNNLDSDKKKNSLMLVREILRDEVLPGGHYIFEYDIVWTSAYLDFMKKFGSVEWEGKLFALLEPVYFNEVEDPCYTASAESMDGELYQVRWGVNDEIMEKMGSDGDWACDWNTVISIEKLEFGMEIPI